MHSPRDSGTGVGVFGEWACAKTPNHPKKPWEGAVELICQQHETSGTPSRGACNHARHDYHDVIAC